MNIHQETLEIWKNTEKSLRKDRVAREVFRLLLQGAYRKSMAEK